MPRTLELRRALAITIAMCPLVVAPLRAADHDQDSAFGVNGVYGPDRDLLVRAATRLPNQDLAVVGALETGDDAYVDWARIAPNGGVVWECGHLVPLVAQFTGRAVAADRNGNLLVGGTAITAGSTQERALIVRLAPAVDPCMTLDTGWSDAGFELFSGGFCDDEDCSLVGVVEAPSPSARTFVLVESKVSSSDSRYFVVALQSSGAINPLFGASGWAEVTATGLGTLSSRGAHLAADSQGRPLVLATRHDPNAPSGDLDPVLLRFTTSGALDTTLYGGAGFRILAENGADDEEGAALALAADGAIFAAVNVLGGNHTGTLYGGQPGGALGWSSTQSLPIATISVQGDGKILSVANATDGDAFVISRFVRTAVGFTADPTFGTHPGYDIYGVNLGGDNGQRVVASVLSEGRLVVLGTADTSTGNLDALFAIRLKSRYVFGDGFESGSRVLWSAAH